MTTTSVDPKRPTSKRDWIARRGRFGVEVYEHVSGLLVGSSVDLVQQAERVGWDYHVSIAGPDRSPIADEIRLVREIFGMEGAQQDGPIAGGFAIHLWLPIEDMVWLTAAVGTR